jgi:hypothetical protein
MQAHGGPILILKKMEIHLGSPKPLRASAQLQRLNKVGELHAVV